MYFTIWRLETITTPYPGAFGLGLDTIVYLEVHAALTGLTLDYILTSMSESQCVTRATVKGYSGTPWAMRMKMDRNDDLPSRATPVHRTGVGVIPSHRWVSFESTA